MTQWFDEKDADLAYDKGFDHGAASRQDEVSKLQAEVDELQKRIDKLSPLLERYGYDGWVAILKGERDESRWL